MQHGVYGAVGIIGGIFSAGAGKLVKRMKARYLVGAGIFLLFDQLFRNGHQVQVLRETGECSGENEQGGGNNGLPVQQQAFLQEIVPAGL